MVDADFSNMGDAFTAIRQKADETVRDWHARRFPRAVEEHALARQAKDIGSAAVWALVLADIFG